MSDQLRLSAENHGPYSVVAITGELDLFTAPLLRQNLKTLIANGRTMLVVDTSDLEFCDSAGLEPLLETRDEVTRVGGELHLTGVHGTLARVLAASGLHSRCPGSALPPHTGSELLRP